MPGTGSNQRPHLVRARSPLAEDLEEIVKVRLAVVVDIGGARSNKNLLRAAHTPQLAVRESRANREPRSVISRRSEMTSGGW